MSSNSHSQPNLDNHNHDINYGLPKVEYSHVVALIPGIRDIGNWESSVGGPLRRRGVHVATTKRWYFGGFEFLSPIDLTQTAVNDVMQSLQNLRTEYPNAKVSVIAHSFGTFVLQQVLRKDHNLRLWKVICCGSVLDNRFRWSEFRDRIGDGTRPTKDFILNDCGTGDYWPVLGASFGFRYGIGGVTGFSDDTVTNRFHSCYGGGHNLFFNQEFVSKHWAGYLLDDKPVPRAEGKAASGLRLRYQLLLMGITRRILQTLASALWLSLLVASAYLCYLGLSTTFDRTSEKSPQAVTQDLLDVTKIDFQQFIVGDTNTNREPINDVGLGREIAFQVVAIDDQIASFSSDYFGGSALIVEVDCNRRECVLDRIELTCKSFEAGLVVETMLDGGTNQGPTPDHVFLVDANPTQQNQNSLFKFDIESGSLRPFVPIEFSQGKHRLFFQFSRTSSGRGAYELALYLHENNRTESTRTVLVSDLRIAFIELKR